MTCIAVWKHRLRGKESPSILLTGACPQVGTVQEDKQPLVPNGVWTGTDIEDGEGVDIVGDLEVLDKITANRFDAIFCGSTLEHVKRPWLAMDSLFQLLKPEGLLFLGTHQTFPLHGYPNDYFRFSREALTSMAEDSGFNVLLTEYGFPCTITPTNPESVTVWNPDAESYLNVSLFACRERD